MKRIGLLTCAMMLAWMLLGACGGGSCENSNSPGLATSAGGQACHGHTSVGLFTNMAGFNGDSSSYVSSDVTVVNPPIPGAKYSVICKLLTRKFTVLVPSLSLGDYPIDGSGSPPSTAATLDYIESSQPAKDWRAQSGFIRIQQCPDGGKVVETIMAAGALGSQPVPISAANADTAGTADLDFGAHL